MWARTENPSCPSADCGADTSLDRSQAPAHEPMALPYLHTNDVKSGSKQKQSSAICVHLGCRAAVLHVKSAAAHLCVDVVRVVYNNLSLVDTLHNAPAWPQRMLMQYVVTRKA